MALNEEYLVEGMSCASCVSHVEKAVKDVSGVSEVSVSLLTNSMRVSYNSPANKVKIINAVKNAGYKASIATNDQENNDTKKLVKILIFSIILLVPLFYISMGYMMMDTNINWAIGLFKDYPIITGITFSFFILSQ